MSKPLFPILRKQTPVLDLFMQRAKSKKTAKPGEELPIPELTPEQKELAQDFKRGIAKRSGKPIEEISDKQVNRWVVNWTRAFQDPQYWKQRGYIEKLGEDIVDMIMATRQSAQLVDPLETTLPDRMPERGKPSEEERRDRFSRSEPDISVG